MTATAPILRLCAGLSIVAAVASACGGQSFSSGEREDEAGSPSEGGNSSIAGKSHIAGDSFGAGNGPGGRASAGTSAGGTGMAGSTSAGASGAGPDDACSGPYTQPLDVGGCAAAFPYWTHDDRTGVCMPIYYGGCGGTKNLYKTLAECQAACPGGQPNYDACKAPTDCTLVAAGCCGVCDSPNVTGHDFVAVNKTYSAKVAPCAGDVACGACPPSNSQGSLKYFVPNCVQGQCIVQDLRESPVTACKAASDCKVRSGNGCCPGCDTQQLLSVRNDGSFEKLVCGSSPPPCAACLPQPDAIAVCGANARCDVAYPVTD